MDDSFSCGEADAGVTAAGQRPPWLSQALDSSRRCKPVKKKLPDEDLSFVDRARLSANNRLSYTLPPPSSSLISTPASRLNSRIPNATKLPKPAVAVTAPVTHQRKTSSRLGLSVKSNERNTKKATALMRSRTTPAVPAADTRNRRSSGWTANEHLMLKKAVASGSLTELHQGEKFWDAVSLTVGRPAVECAREVVRIEETRLDGRKNTKKIEEASLAELRAKIPNKGNTRQWRVQQFMERAAFHRDAPQDLLEKSAANRSGRRSSATPLWAWSMEALQDFKTGLTPRPSVDEPVGCPATHIDELVERLLPDASGDGNYEGIAVPDLVAPSAAAKRSLRLQRFADRHRRKIEESRKTGPTAGPAFAAPKARKADVQCAIEKKSREEQQRNLQDEVDQLKWALQNCVEPTERAALEEELNAMNLSDDDDHFHSAVVRDG